MSTMTCFVSSRQMESRKLALVIWTGSCVWSTKHGQRAVHCQMMRSERLYWNRLRIPSGPNSGHKSIKGEALLTYEERSTNGLHRSVSKLNFTQRAHRPGHHGHLIEYSYRWWITDVFHKCWLAYDFFKATQSFFIGVRSAKL